MAAIAVVAVCLVGCGNEPGDPSAAGDQLANPSCYNHQDLFNDPKFSSECAPMPPSGDPTVTDLPSEVDVAQQQTYPSGLDCRETRGGTSDYIAGAGVESPEAAFDAWLPTMWRNAPPRSEWQRVAALSNDSQVVWDLSQPDGRWVARVLATSSGSDKWVLGSHWGCTKDSQAWY